MHDQVRVGLIGTGKRGLLYTRLLAAEPKARLAAVLDLDAERAQWVASRHGTGVRVARDLAELLAECDAVVIATPDNSHAELAVAALNSGRPTLCDKPPGISIDEINRVSSALRDAAATPFTLAMVLRYHPLYQALLEILPAHGAVSQVKVADLMNGQFYFRRWHRHRSYTGGIVLHEGIHSLDILGWMLGHEPDTVVGLSSPSQLLPRPDATELCRDCVLAPDCEHYFDVRSDPLRELYRTPRQQEGEPRDVCVFNSVREIDEVHDVVLGYTGRLQVSYSLNLVAPVRTRQFTFVCEDAVISTDEAAATITVVTADGRAKRDIEVPKAEYGGGDSGHIADFMRMVLDGNRDDTTLDSNFGAAVTALAAERSIRDRIPVRVAGGMKGGFQLCTDVVPHALDDHE
ncbi:Gfo/Idh/MocA family oxidoreductase [Micromonosporaceae bacterium B7E4]